jgi:hypothetical protein
MSGIVFPPPGPAVSIPVHGMKLRKGLLANRYYDTLLVDKRGGGKPYPHDVFAEMIEDICNAVGLPTETVDDNVFIRHLLYHTDTSNLPLLALAVQLAFGE